MKVAYVVPSLAPKGPVIVVNALVREMVAHGHECHVYFFDETEEKLSFPCPVQKIGLLQRIPFSDFQIIHTHCARPNLYAFLHRPLIHKRSAARWISTLHSYIFQDYGFMYPRWKSYWMGRLFIATVQGLDKVVTLSQDAKAYYAKWIQPRKLDVVYNGIERDDVHRQIDTESVYRQILNFKGDALLVGTYCPLLKVKNLDFLLDAFQLLPPSMKLLIIGSGTEQGRLQEKIDQNAVIRDRVLMIPERSDTRSFLPLMDVFTITSLSEGFCLSLVEAAMAKCSVVCADIPGMREKFSEEEITYFDVQSKEELRKAIMSALHEDDKREKAYERAMKMFTSEQMYQGYVRVYSAALRAEMING